MRSFPILVMGVIVVVGVMNFVVIREALDAIAVSNTRNPLVMDVAQMVTLIPSFVVSVPSTHATTLAPTVIVTPVPTTVAPITTAPTTAPPTYALYGAKETPTSLKNIANAAVLILCYNRPDYLAATIKGLHRAAFASKLKVYVSQDGNDESVSDVIKSFSKKSDGRLVHLKHAQIPREKLPYRVSIGTQRLARHYKWALDQVMLQHNHSHAIVLEDDMIVSHDVFSFFEQTAPLLDTDNATWCISTWNDLAFSAFDLPKDRLFRTDFFPGLGWMLTKRLWAELSPIFPIDHWDHWMRVPTINKGRSCIVPYLNRNRNIGVQGANVDENEYEQYLKNILWYEDKSLVALGDLSYLRVDAYVATIAAGIHTAHKVIKPEQYDSMRSNLSPGETYLVLYVKESFPSLADVFGIYPTPKAIFQHVVTLSVNRATLYLADRRHSDLVPAKYRLLPSKSLTAVPSTSVGLNCYDVCTSVHKDCSENDFEFINQCDVLALHFPCQAGCSREWGPDIPNYAANPADKKNYQKCLITEDSPSCDAAHPSTMRLCPCV